MGHRLAKLRALSWAEWRLLLAAALLFSLTGIGLRLLGFQRSQRWLGRWVRRRAHQEPLTQTERGEAARVARIVAIAARHGPVPASCLRQALVLWLLLGRRGIPGRLRIGATREETGFAAHAWVELGEQVLIGGDQRVRERYAILL